MGQVSNIDETPTWRRASFCSSGCCVEVRYTFEGVNIRDSKMPGERWLLFTAREWSAFVAGVKAGEFDAGAA